MAGYTDRAFRNLCKDWGVDYLVSEMVSADGLIRDKAKTIQYIHFDSRERPYGVQIFGSDPLTMARAAEALIPFQPDFIDINMGCPVKKVVKRGAGSALMKTPEIASDIVKAVKKVTRDTLPLTVKFRSGWDSAHINFLSFGLLMQDSGADILCLHPRTTSQMFSGKSNWQHIRELKSQASIPVIGNGDIDSPEAALAMVEETHCDALMIGRGALGKPWIFRQITDYLSTGNYRPIIKSDLFATAMKHLDYALAYKREDIVVREMRSQMCHYTKGMPGGAELRATINHCGSAQEIRDNLKDFFQHFL